MPRHLSRLLMSSDFSDILLYCSHRTILAHSFHRPTFLSYRHVALSYHMYSYHCSYLVYIVLGYRSCSNKNDIPCVIYPAPTVGSKSLYSSFHSHSSSSTILSSSRPPSGSTPPGPRCDTLTLSITAVEHVVGSVETQECGQRENELLLTAGTNSPGLCFNRRSKNTRRGRSRRPTMSLYRIYLHVFYIHI